eukprot:2690110-Ditylum_brightwellii.AAC.1
MMEELQLGLFRPAILPPSYSDGRIGNGSFQTSHSTSHAKRSGTNLTREYKNAADVRELVSSDRRVGNGSFQISHSASPASRCGNNLTKKCKHAANVRELLRGDGRVGN